MKKVMITGSSGYIGSNLCSLLDKSKYEVIEIDKKIGKDILDINLNGYNPDVIIHLAAIASIGECESNVSQATDDNILACIKISNFARDCAVPLFFASSQAVKSPRSSVYAYSKYVGEKLLQMNNDYVIMRFANVFGGINFIDDKTSVVAKWIRRYRAHAPLIINGDGEQTRDFVYVNDICGFIIYCMENGIINDTLDIGTGAETSINYLSTYFPPDAMIEYDFQSNTVGVLSNVADTKKLEVMKIKPTVFVGDYLRDLWSK